MAVTKALATATLALALASLPSGGPLLAEESDPAAGGAAGAGASRDADEEAPGPPGPSGAESPTLHGELALSLQDAIAMGIENNLQVAIERHTPLVADEELEASWGTYDPELFAELDYSSVETPIASTLETSNILETQTVEGASGLTGLVPRLGLQYELAYTGASNETTSAIQSLSPEYSTTLALSGTLPLLNGFWWGEPWVRVELSQIRTHSAWQEFRQEVMDTVRRIEEAYWGAAAAEEQLRVAEKSLETARALQDQTEAQYEVGVVSRVEVVEAEAGVAEREVDVIDAENQYRAAQDRLIDEVLGPNLTATSRLEIRPTDRPEDIVEYPVDPERVTERAFENRPELALARREIERRRIQLKGAKNERLPQLNLRGSYGYEGLSGDENPNRRNFDPSTPLQPIPIDRDYHDADDDFLSDGGALQASIGAFFSIPLGNREGRANVNVAELELRRSRVQARRQEQQIILDVRDAIRELRSSRESIDAAERRLAAAEEQLRAETIRLEQGESTPFDVLQRERDRAEAEGQRINALRDYHTSVTALDRAQGTILRDRGVVLEEAARLR